MRPRHTRTAAISNRTPPTEMPNERSLKSGRCFFFMASRCDDALGCDNGAVLARQRMNRPSAIAAASVARAVGTKASCAPKRRFSNACTTTNDHPSADGMRSSTTADGRHDGEREIPERAIRLLHVVEGQQRKDRRGGQLPQLARSPRHARRPQQPQRAERRRNRHDDQPVAEICLSQNARNAPCEQRRRNAEPACSPDSSGRQLATPPTCREPAKTRQQRAAAASASRVVAAT